MTEAAGRAGEQPERIGLEHVRAGRLDVDRAVAVDQRRAPAHPVGAQTSVPRVARTPVGWNREGSQLASEPFELSRARRAAPTESTR